MKNIKFIKEPGYIYDLFFLFMLYFNKDYCLKNYINYNKAEEDTDYFNKITSDFELISDDLLLFFYIKEDKKCFMTQLYYEPYKTMFTTTYNLEIIQTALTDYEQVIDNLLKFYFMDIDQQTLFECKKSVRDIGKLIKNSNYNDSVKSNLYAFFLDPIPVIQRLSYELMEKEFQLSKLYEKRFKDIIELQQQFVIDDLSSKLKQINTQQVDLGSFNEFYISICTINKNCIKSHYYDDNLLLILGTDYQNYADFIINQNRSPELDAFGTAISEKNRLEILDLILKKGEISIKDIEQTLGFSGTNSYYHLSLMIKVNMIRTRNQGKTVLYSINEQCFYTIREMLNKYLTKTESRQ